MTKTTTGQRIIRALQSGPLFEGTLRVVVDNPSDFTRAMLALQNNGTIKRDLPDNPYTWRVVA